MCYVVPSSLLTACGDTESQVSLYTWCHCVPGVPWQVYQTPQGVLSSEDGVYVATVVKDKNVRQARGRMKLYGDLDDDEDDAKEAAEAKAKAKVCRGRSCGALGSAQQGVVWGMQRKVHFCPCAMSESSPLSSSPRFCRSLPRDAPPRAAAG